MSEQSSEDAAEGGALEAEDEAHPGGESADEPAEGSDDP
jgi:hypothetical protein